MIVYIQRLWRVMLAQAELKKKSKQSTWNPSEALSADWWGLNTSWVSRKWRTWVWTALSKKHWLWKAERYGRTYNRMQIRRNKFCFYLLWNSSVQLLSSVWLFATPWNAARQASLSSTSSWSLLKLMAIESVMPSNHLILCGPLFLPPSIVPSIRVFSNESALHIR